MKIKEKNVSSLEIIPPAINADSKLKYYEKKERKFKHPKWLENSPLWDKNHILAYIGLRGSGKTSTCISLLTSDGKGKAYRGLYDTVIVCMPKVSMNSLSDKPFDDLEDDQIYYEFNKNFLNNLHDISMENALQNKDTFCLIDDASSKLRSSKLLLDQFENIIMSSRHLRLTIHVLVQEYTFLSPSILSNLSGIFLFRINQRTRAKQIRERFFSFLTDAEFTELESHVYQKKGDFLFLKLDEHPFQYFKKFQEIEFEDLEYKKKVESNNGEHL